MFLQSLLPLLFAIVAVSIIRSQVEAFGTHTTTTTTTTTFAVVSSRRRNKQIPYYGYHHYYGQTVTPIRSKTSRSITRCSATQQRDDDDDDDDDDDNYIVKRSNDTMNLTGLTRFVRSEVNRLRATAKTTTTMMIDHTSADSSNRKNINPYDQRQRTYYGMEQVLQDQFVRESILGTRLPELRNYLQKVRVDKSLVGGSHNNMAAGRGLFAAIPLQKGDVITCYPADGLIFTPIPPLAVLSEEEDFTGYNEMLLWGDHVAAASNNKLQMAQSFSKDYQRLKSYCIDGSSNNGNSLYSSASYSVIGLPFLDDNPAYMGHFANDGAAIINNETKQIKRTATTTTTTETSIRQYVTKSEALVNAEHTSIADGYHIATVATRNIALGEEILVSYGAAYWIGQQ